MDIITIVTGITLWVAFGWGVLWSITALTRHLRARRIGPKPYWWQTARRGENPDAHRPEVVGGWKPFWRDLKSTATTPYGNQTTLQRAYATCVLLFVAAVSPMPYEYYFTLRLAVCIALGFYAIAAYRQRSTRSGWLAAVAFLIVLYNPIIPVHIGVQLVWTAINAATIYTLYRAKLALEQPADSPTGKVA